MVEDADLTVEEALLQSLSRRAVRGGILLPSLALLPPLQESTRHHPPVSHGPGVGVLDLNILAARDASIASDGRGMVPEAIYHASGWGKSPHAEISRELLRPSPEVRGG